MVATPPVTHVTAPPPPPPPPLPMLRVPPACVTSPPHAVNSPITADSSSTPRHCLTGLVRLASSARSAHAIVVYSLTMFRITCREPAQASLSLRLTDVR